MPELGTSGSAGGPGRRTAQVYPPPAEDFFDPTAHFLAGGITRSVGRASVHRTATSCGVLSNVGCDALRPQRLHTVASVLPLVRTERRGMEPARTSFIDQMRHHVSLRRASGRGDLEVH